jgi:hypothetical protein
MRVSFLRRLAAHPALRVAPATVAFLTTVGDLDTDPAWFAVRLAMHTC